MEFGSYTLLLLSTFINIVNPIGNDLHIYEGSSMSDIVGDDVFFEVLEPLELRYSYRIRPAKDFGGQFNENTRFQGAHLVPTYPLHGCSEIKNREELAGHIALSERGECSFVFKTARAQEAGARAIIITDHNKWEDALDNLIEMIDDKTSLDVKIPAAFLLGRSGGTILNTLQKLKKKYAIVNLPVNMTYVELNGMKQPPWIAW